jgi:hypothetical protein
MSFVGQTSLRYEANPPNTVISDVDCDVTVYVSALVRMQGGIAVNALADSSDNANVIGIVEEKSSTTKCVIRFLGVTGQIFTGLDETKEYYLSDVIAGLLTTTIPVASGHVVLKIGQPFNDKQLLVLKGTRLVRA